MLVYLDRADPDSARKARARYACFDHAHEDSQAYGYGASYGLTPSCEDEVVQQLRDMNRRFADIPSVPGLERDEAFYAQQNARLVHNAEEYYRTMFRGRVSSWNLRDSHMVETLQALDRHLATGATPPRIAVWAHNSHLGDASATEMGDIGEWNVGQLIRDRYANDAALIGFSTHRGWVTAASEWDDPPHRKRVREGLPGSWEDALHQMGVPRFMLPLRGNEALKSLIAQPRRLQRAIGVIYRPETERQSHYFFTRLAEQFDAVIHIDQTHALEPLDRGPVWHTGEAPETYPSALERVASAGRPCQPRDQYECDHREDSEPDERPVGQGRAQESPVDLGTVTAALEDHGDDPLQREGLDHSVEVAPARRDLGRIPLQEALARGHESAEPREEQHEETAHEQHGAVARQRREPRGQHHHHQRVTLHDAHRARVQSHDVLQVQAEGQHADADAGHEAQHPPRRIVKPLDQILPLT